MIIQTLFHRIVHVFNQKNQYKRNCIKLWPAAKWITHKKNCKSNKSWLFRRGINDVCDFLQPFFEAINDTSPPLSFENNLWKMETHSDWHSQENGSASMTKAEKKQVSCHHITSFSHTFMVGNYMKFKHNLDFLVW